MSAVTPGRVVESRAGRDKGRLLVVLRVEGEFAYLADGDLRKCASPKKKKLRHLFPKKECLDIPKENDQYRTVEWDAEIRKHLNDMTGKEG